MTKCSSCLSQNSQQGALNWLVGHVWVLLKNMENLENGQSRVSIAMDAVVASSPATVQGGRTKICVQVASVFPEYIAPASVASHAPPASISFAAPALVVDRVSPDFTVYAVQDLVVVVMEHISPAPAVYAALVPVEEFVSSTSASTYTSPCYGTHFSSSSGVCCTRSCGLIRRSSADIGSLSWNTLLRQLLQCMPHQTLRWSTSHQRRWVRRACT